MEGLTVLLDTSRMKSMMRLVRWEWARRQTRCDAMESERIDVCCAECGALVNVTLAQAMEPVTCGADRCEWAEHDRAEWAAADAALREV